MSNIRNSRGAALIETAVALPIVLMLFLGGFYFMMTLTSRATMTRYSDNQLTDMSVDENLYNSMLDAEKDDSVPDLCETTLSENEELCTIVDNYRSIIREQAIRTLFKDENDLNGFALLPESIDLGNIPSNSDFNYINDATAALGNANNMVKNPRIILPNFNDPSRTTDQVLQEDPIRIEIYSFVEIPLLPSFSSDKSPNYKLNTLQVKSENAKFFELNSRFSRPTLVDCAGNAEGSVLFNSVPCDCSATPNGVSVLVNGEQVCQPCPFESLNHNPAEIDGQDGAGFVWTLITNPHPSYSRFKDKCYAPSALYCRNKYLPDGGPGANNIINTRTGQCWCNVNSNAGSGTGNQSATNLCDCADGIEDVVKDYNPYGNVIHHHADAAGLDANGLCLCLPEDGVTVLNNARCYELFPNVGVHPDYTETVHARRDGCECICGLCPNGTRPHPSTACSCVGRGECPNQNFDLENKCNSCLVDACGEGITPQLSNNCLCSCPDDFVEHCTATNGSIDPENANCDCECASDAGLISDGAGGCTADGQNGGS